nr:type 4 pilus major pilin [Pandoraea terrae]
MGARRRQRGMSLVEIGVVVALVGVLMAGAFVGVPAIMMNLKANGEVTDLQEAAAGIQRIAMGSAITMPPSGTALGAPAAHALGFYPSHRFTSSTGSAGTGGAATTINGLKNRFNGDITITPLDAIVTGQGKGIEILSKAVPTAACVKVVGAVAGVFDEILVGSEAVKPFRGPLNMATLATGCAAENPDVTYKIALQ